MMHKLTVNTASHRYPIFIDANLSNTILMSLPQYIPNRQVAIITNETVAPLYLQQWQSMLTQLNYHHFSIVIPDGEMYKNWETLNMIYDQLLERHAERHTTLIALGGGVIGDMVGFAAATYQRGAPFIQVPTTLLSQVDSSVGGKTAINHPLGKNMIGAFYQPQAVFSDIHYLHTLPPREFSAGMAEVIKYALLGDYQFLLWLEENITALMALQPDILANAIHHCCQMKSEIVAQDTHEKGIRAHLNLGHTFGHAIEAEMGYGNWLHGEAVSVGIILACKLSEQLGYLKLQDTHRVISLLRKANLPTDIPDIPLSRWIEHMQHDKKVEHGCLRFVALKSLGEATIVKDISTDQLASILSE